MDDGWMGRQAGRHTDRHMGLKCKESKKHSTALVTATEIY